MKVHLLIALSALSLLRPAVSRAQDKPWVCDATIYFMLAGLSGDVGVKGHTADVNASVSDIFSHLQGGFMGRGGVRHHHWRLALDVIYMSLEGTSDSPPATAKMDQWVVEPSLGYRTSETFEVLGGVRYNNISGDLTFEGPLGLQGSGTEEWWDPFVGGRLTLPLYPKLTFEFRGDVGGFGIGSDIALQGEATLNWHLSRVVGLQFAYRAIYTDYEDTDNGFLYSAVTNGPQLGVKFTF